ncbi:hypothetical protein [Phocaeicola plebeius]|jgi:hypothetical protein|uniref:hypothetical protein n=1 Tax=Phocaeicola plebeius TaxID=310297 RepID=UPI000E4711FF|nr:hypothetical protein [Phocaeicola plebeius]RHJ67661.1 hypothetical protein DW110_03225 [Phocaeicola plebeius]
MAGIFSDVSTDIQKLRQLKAEIENVKKALKGIDVNVKIDIAKGMEAQLQSLMKKYDALVKKVSEAEGKIMSSTKRINDASEKIIKAQEQLSKAAGMNTKPDNGNADVSLNNVGTANVQAQAKAYDELAKEIDSVMGTRSQNIKRMIDEQNAIRLINEEIKKLTKFQTGNSTLTNTQQKRLEQLNNSLLTHKAALSDVRQTLMNNVKLDNSATTSMNGISQSLSRMRIAYRELTEEERNSPFGKELLASIQQADAKIKELDATIGNHQRNVGNYAKGYNGLNMSVQQIVRELPSAAMGLNMFFLAISNNLPILTDEIKRAKAANEELKVSGQKGIPVWKQVVSSLFSWQSALMVGITLLTVHGDKVWEWAKRIIVGESAAEKMKKTLIELNEIEKNAYATQIKTRMELNGIISSIEKFNGTKEQEKQKIDELNSKYGSIFGAYNNLAQWYDVLINKGDAYINSLFAQAKAQSYIQKAMEAEQKIRDIKANGIESYRPTWGAGGKVYQFFGGGKKNQYGSDPAELAYNAALAQAENEKSNALKNAEEAQSTYLNEIKKGGIFDYRTIINKDAERQKKEQQQLAEELLQLRRTNQQEEINLMEEGSEKKRRQIELDYQREIDEIRKQRKKWEDAQGGKLTSEQRDVLGNRASNAMQSREKGLAEITETENQAAIEANERYLKSYGTFMQKRDAIIAEYTRKISEATTQGDKDILQKEMDKALSSLDLEKLKQGINWELIFGDLDKVSKESLNKVKQQLRDFKNSEEYKNMAVDQKKVVDEALSNIQSTLIDKGGLLADLPEQLSELAKAQEELSQAQEEYNEAMRSGTDEQKEAATKKLNDAQKRQQNAQVNVQKSTDKTTSNLVTLSNVITQLGSNSEISLSQVGDLAGNIVDIFAEESEKLGGIIGAAFSLLDAIGTQGLDGFVGNIFSSVFKSVGGIWDTLTFGGFSKLFGIGGNEKEVQDTINRLTDRNEKLQSAIESLTEEMKSSKGSEKSVAEYNKAIKYQEEYNKNVLAKAQANAGYHSSHHSWAYYMGWSESDIQWIRENVMAEFTGTDSLWQMSPEQMDLLRQNVDLWQKMADSGKGGYGNAVVDALDEYADLAGNLEELKEGLFEQLTGISFDSMYDSFIDTLMDMDASAEDFADNLSEYFMRAMLSDKIGNMYSQKLENWWNRFGESMKDGNLSESERNSLQNEYMGYVNEALKLRDELAAATGYDKAGSSSQQSASSRGFGTEMTHEDAGELSGRFTAVYESNLRIETAEQQQTIAITELRGSIGSLTSQATGLYNIADETRTILANSYLELQQIRENTGEIVKPIKQMQADIAEVKRNTSRL